LSWVVTSLSSHVEKGDDGEPVLKWIKYYYYGDTKCVMSYTPTFSPKIEKALLCTKAEAERHYARVSRDGQEKGYGIEEVNG
jgi:hypothetical protein